MGSHQLDALAAGVTRLHRFDANVAVPPDRTNRRRRHG
jgi:hypothetical protein